MELLLKTAAAALTAVLINLMIRRYNPEISLGLSLCAITVIFAAALRFSSGLMELVDAVKSIAGSENMMIAPVIKCLAIALITKISAELCRDASQAASAAAVEFAGTVCAMGVTVPMIISMLKTIGSMV